MLDGYHEYFEERLTYFEESGSDDDPAQLAALGAVAQARETATENGRPLRPDAALLIYLLSYELVARPVVSVIPDEQDELPDVLAQDVRQIVTTAATLGHGEITSHSIINALSSSWQHLISAQYRVWG